MTAPDLDCVLRELRGLAQQGPMTPLPPLRSTESLPAQVPDDVAAKRIRSVTPRLPVEAWLDGIQSQYIVWWVRHRPVIAQYVAAIAVGVNGDLVGKEESVRFVCSEADERWVSSRVPPAWLDVVPEGDETAIRAAATARQEARRWSAERTLSARVAGGGTGVVVVDGPLSKHQRLSSLAGVVKSHPGAYLPSEWHLHTLGEGEITFPAFELLAPGTQEPTGRHSRYLRLHDHAHQGVMHGLVRLEAYDEALLPELAATCMAFRQFDPSADARWDRHLRPIAWAEYLGRTRAPRWQ